jgi:hypothetical protein
MNDGWKLSIVLSSTGAEDGHISVHDIHLIGHRTYDLNKRANAQRHRNTTSRRYEHLFFMSFSVGSVWCIPVIIAANLVTARLFVKDKVAHRRWTIAQRLALSKGYDSI